jgi:hypothetical protein
MAFFSFGKNNLTTKFLFREREKYELIVAQEVKDKNINMWFRKIKFGRVDYSGDAVYASNSKLKQIKTDDDNIFLLLDFVADAFDDFREFYNTKISVSNDTTSPTPYAPIIPNRAWESVDVAYKEYLTDLYDSFAFYINSNNLHSQIRGFKSFVSQFINFLSETTKGAPITKSAFLVNEDIPLSPINSGLCIEIGNKDPSEDLPKLSEFIYDKNFNAFKNAAARFGFVVDINVPWRLVADIESRPMGFYMNKRGTTDSRDMFNKYFYKAYLNEIEIIKNLFFNFYNVYVTNIPSATTTKRSGGKTKAAFINRELISNVEFSKIDDLYWLRIYAFLRAKEMKCGLNQTQFDDLVTKAFDLRKGLDLFSSLGYINKQVKMFSERNTINALEGRFVPNTFIIKG